MAEAADAGGRFRVSTGAAPDESAIRLEGRLTSPDLPLLEDALNAARERGDALRLDLSGLRSLDDESARHLAGVARAGVELLGASGFVTSLLRALSQP